MPKGFTEVICQGCGCKFYGQSRRKYCDMCEEEIWYTCPDCGEPKRYKYSTREKADRHCQICNKSAEENGRRLDVHHIDGDKSNHDPDNLVALCHSCHQLITVGAVEDPFEKR